MSQRVEALRKAQHEFYKKQGAWPKAVRMHPVFFTHLRHESELRSWGNPGRIVGDEFEGMKVEITKNVHAFEVRAASHVPDAPESDK